MISSARILVLSLRLSGVAGRVGDADSGWPARGGVAIAGGVGGTGRRTRGGVAGGAACAGMPGGELIVRMASNAFAHGARGAPAGSGSGRWLGYCGCCMARSAQGIP